LNLSFPNPLVRRVRVRYWHAEAIVKKRHKNFIDTKFVYFDSVTPEAAARGLRNIIISQGYRMQRYKGVMEHVTTFSIPFWRLAYWFPWLTRKHMEKKGFAPNVCSTNS
jgi:hypothetical protein